MSYLLTGDHNPHDAAKDAGVVAQESLRSKLIKPVYLDSPKLLENCSKNLSNGTGAWVLIISHDNSFVGQELLNDGGLTEWRFLLSFLYVFNDFLFQKLIVIFRLIIEHKIHKTMSNLLKGYRIYFRKSCSNFALQKSFIQLVDRLNKPKRLKRRQIYFQTVFESFG